MARLNYYTNHYLNYNRIVILAHVVGPDSASALRLALMLMIRVITLNMIKFNREH